MKLKITLVSLFLILVLARLLAPVFVLRKLNADLATISPVYQLQVRNLHISLIRMFYRLEGVHGLLKKNNKPFADIERIDVSVAWAQLFRGRILTDVLVDGANLVLSPDLFSESKKPEAKPVHDAKTARDKLFPLQVNSINLERTRIQFGEFIHEGDSPTWQVSEIQGLLANLTPTPISPFTFFNLRGTMLQSSQFKASGKARRLNDPVDWETQVEVHEFNLPKTNKLVYHFVPLTFTSGTLDLFAEAKSQNGKIEGYVKPFIKKMHVVGNKNDFRSIQHFAVEMATALGNAILRRPQDQSVATKVEFYTDAGKLKVKTDKAIGRAVEHGFGEPLAESLENTVHLN